MFRSAIKETVYKEARELLKKMGLSDKEDYYPCQLSGGQCQRGDRKSPGAEPEDPVLR